MYVPLIHRWVLSRQQLMPPFVRCKRVRNASAAAPCLLAVDRGNGIHIAGHRNRHGTGFCAQLPLTHGPASTCNTGHLFAQEVALKTNVSIALGDTNWDWFKRMELGSKVWGNLLANSSSGFLSDTTWRPKQHLAPPFDTAPVSRPLLESAVERFPEWRGCWGCVHNDSDTHCCSGRGDCRMGLCMCRDGAFGMDCAHEAEARSTQAGTTVEPAAEAATQGLRIYVHEMPFELGQTWLASVPASPRLWSPMCAHLQCCGPYPLTPALLAPPAVHTYADGMDERWNDRGDPIYSAEWRFLHSLLRDPTVRTLDPHAADLFFVPLLTSYGLTSNTGCPSPDVQVAVHHLQRTMPYFWQRHGGADHVFFATGDKGFCNMNSVPKQLAANPIFVSHFGLLGDFDAMSAFERLPAKFDKPTRTLKQQLKNGEWIFAPHKDVVVPGVT